MAQRDDISKAYKTSKIICTWCLVLFWTNAILAFAALLPLGRFAPYVFVGQSVTAIAFVLLECTDELHFWYLAERARRRHLVENAFGIDLTNATTEGYYNNEFSHGEKRLIANAFESVFFTMRIVRRMLSWSLVKGAIAILTFIAVIMVSRDYSLFPVFTQTVFSSYMIIGTTRTLVYSSRLDHLYEEMYRTCVTLGISSSSERVRALVDVEEYECLKAHFKVRLSERQYVKLNSGLSAEWEDIAKKIKIGKSPRKQ